MTNIQLFFAILGSMVTLIGLLYIVTKNYIDAKFVTTDSKIDNLTKNVDTLVQYMISHEGRIATLEERTKK